MATKVGPGDKLRELLADAQDQRQSWIRQLEESRAGEGHPRKVRLRERIAAIEADIQDLQVTIREVGAGGGNAA